MQAVLDLLDKIEETAKGIPPVDNKASRFGNPAFRTFYDKVSEVRTFPHIAFVYVMDLGGLKYQIAPQLHKSIPELPEAAIPEIIVYFEESWGNRTRIDYGSGMELNFLCWMYVRLAGSSRGEALTNACIGSAWRGSGCSRRATTSRL